MSLDIVVPSPPLAWEPPEATRAVWPKGRGASGLTAVAETVYAYLVHVGGVTAEGPDVTASACRMSPRTVRRAMTELEHHGLIRREPSGAGARRRRVVVTEPGACGGEG